MDGRATAAVLVAEDEPLAFASVGAALAHARGLQPGGRVGVAAGTEPEAAAVAARLRDAAEPGQVLVTDAARWADSDGDPFRDAGPLDRGGAAIHAWELLWAEPVPRTRARLCGEPALAIDGERLEAPRRPGRRAARRSCSPARSAPRTARELIEILWPGRAPRDPQAALRPILSRLRRALGPAELEGRERLRLRLPEPVWTDLGAAADALAAARSAARGEQWAPARAHAQAALRLLRPGFLAGVDDDWAAAPRLEAEELELEALEWIARASLALGGPELGAAERAGRELVARSPFRETGPPLPHGGARRRRQRRRGAARLRRPARAAARRARDRARRGAAGAAPAAADGDARRGPRSPRSRRRWRSRSGSRRASAPCSSPATASWSGCAPRGTRPAAAAGGSSRSRASPASARRASRRSSPTSAAADGTVLSAACQQDVLLPYQPFVEALRGAGLDWARVAAMPGAGELVARDPGAAGRAGRAGGRRGAAALPPVRGDRLAARRDRRAGAARADPRRPALGRPRHAPPPAPRRPRAAPGARADPRHLPRRRGAALAPARGAARRPPPRRARGADRRSRASTSATSAR